MRMRTGKRRSAPVISSRGLAGIVFLICSPERLHDRFTVSSRLGLSPGNGMLVPCVAAPVSPPMSARSSQDGPAAVFVLLALVGCAQVATGPAQSPYSHENGTETRGGSNGSGGRDM